MILSKVKIFLFNHLPQILLIGILNLKKSYEFKVNKVKKNIYKVQFESSVLYISRPKRLFKYKSGYKSRMLEIQDKYFISEISFNHEDIVIDCGSNIGELPLAIESMSNKHLRVIAIEPDPIEFEVLKLNLDKSAIHLNFFLSNVSSISQALYNNDSGDSHLISIGETGRNLRKSFPVLTRTLDDLILPLNLISIKLMKIEVEGFEAEVLQGGRRVLEITQYVTVDSGPEKNGSYTFNAVNTILVKAGFKLIRNNQGLSALFAKL